MNKHIIKVKDLISNDACMGTYGLVELELLEMEKEFKSRIKELEQFIKNGYEYGYIHFDPIDENDSAFETFKSLFGEEESTRIKR